MDCHSEIEREIDEEVGDDVLRLILVACHPVLSKEARTALTLRLLGGLPTEEKVIYLIFSEGYAATPWGGLDAPRLDAGRDALSTWSSISDRCEVAWGGMVRGLVDETLESV